MEAEEADIAHNERMRIGFELLKLLAKTGHLYFWTRHGLIENQKFRSGLFREVLLQAGEVGCQNGKTIAVREFARAMRLEL